MSTPARGKNLRHYYNQRAIQSLEPATEGSTVVIKCHADGDDVRIPIIFWALTEFFNEEDNKTGVVVTAVFADPFDEQHQLHTLTTLDIYTMAHPEHIFLGFGGPHVEPTIGNINK